MRAGLSASPLNFRTGLRAHPRAGNELNPPPTNLGRETRGAPTPDTTPNGAPFGPGPPPPGLPNRRRPRGGAAPTLAAQPLGSPGERQGEGRVPARGSGSDASPLRPGPGPAGRGAPGEAWSLDLALGLSSAQPLGPP